MSNEQQTQQADDPSGDRWRDVIAGEILQPGDMIPTSDIKWQETRRAGKPALSGMWYRRRIEPQQPSDSDPETIDSWEMRLAKMTQWNSELEALVDEAERSGQQVNAELQQLREQLATSQHLAEMSRRQVADEAGKIEQLKEQVQTLTWERDRYRNQLAGAIEHSKAPEAQAQLLDRLQAWLRPVLELVAEHPEDASPLAVAVLGFLPGIASRLIEE